MLKIIVFMLCVLSSAVLGQKFNRENIPLNKFQYLFSDVYEVPSDSLTQIYYTYKIPNSRLVFIKDGQNYSSEFTLAVEVQDSNSNFVVRQFQRKIIHENNFENTISRDVYSEGVINMSLPFGGYKLLPVLTDKNSDREIKLNPIPMEVKNFKKSLFLKPIIVEAAAGSCEGKNVPVLTNFENNIPFSNNVYDLILPVADISINSIYISIIDDKDTVTSQKVGDFFESKLSLEACNNKVILKSNETAKQYKLFMVKNFSRKLDEGPAKIVVSTDKDFKNPQIFKIEVKWYNKPISLTSPEFAIKELKHIEDEDTVDELLHGREEGYSKRLFEFWKKYDPTPSTEFNELMDEYYARVDFALQNYASLTKRNGADSDRGKIFIRYGKPDKVERATNKNGKVVETWVYKKNDMKFVFVDKQGTGNFSLENG